MSESEALTLIRQYVGDSQDEARRDDASAVMQLLADKPTAVATLNAHFNSFTGHDRFWLYSLAGLLLGGDPQAHAQFYAHRARLEDDPSCRKLVMLQQNRMGGRHT
jgi:hypothetical protein